MPCLLCLNPNVTGEYATHLEHGLAECQANTGGKKQIVGFEPREWIAEVAVAVSDLPTEPVFQLGCGGGVKLEAVGACLGDVGVDAELLGNGGATVEFGVEGFAEDDFASLACNGGHGWLGCGSGGGSKERLIVAAAAKDIERRGLGIDHVIAEATTEDVAQIEVLKLVVFEVGETEDEKPIADIQVAANPAANGVSGGGVDAVDGAIAVNGGGIDGDFVSLRNTGSFAGKRISERLRVSSGNAKAGV